MIRLLFGNFICFVFASIVSAADPTIIPDVVYGHKDGLALTFDVFQPEEPNGAGILYIQSGGWYSAWREPATLLPVSRPLLDRGITVFIVRHGSAPKYAIPDAVADVRRAVRFIRMRCKDWGVDEKRLGVLGGSAGGHLSLMLATTGDDGDPNAKDDVLKQSDRVAAAVALYPPTDIRRWTTDPPEAIQKIPGLKPPLTFDATKEPDYSPLLHVSSSTPPVLLIHGALDELVPIEHSRNFDAAMQKVKATCKLLVIDDAGHSFTAKHNETVVPAVCDWFAEHL